MINKMLINANQAEEVRVAIVNGSYLDNIDIEILGKEQQKSNIYEGKITRIEPSLEAVFVDYGAQRHGFLPFREISKVYYKKDKKTDAIQDKLNEGQELIVQISKEIRGNKGAALTTQISLAGCYLVLMPMNPTSNGISRRIDAANREEIREVISALKIPDHMGVIVRTAGVGKNIHDLQWDLDILIRQWDAIKKAAENRQAPFLIFQESSVVVRAIRDYLRPDIDEILVDNLKVFNETCMYIKMMRPDYINKVKFYNDNIPLFSRFQIESQIEMAFQREITLTSGGSVVIDNTEALVSIDINSARATKGHDIEETALTINLEASEEIARQLRLRDIGGLIVIDFIDMNISRNQREVEQKLREALEVDRARIQIGKISKFGLLEMSRQRLKPALSTARDITCPRCLGKGAICSIKFLSLNILRLIEEEAIKDNTIKIMIEVPNKVAIYLINEKRKSILNIEQKHKIDIILIPRENLITPNYQITRLKNDDSSIDISYNINPNVNKHTNHYMTQYATKKTENIVAAVSSSINLNMIAHKPNIIKRFFKSIMGLRNKQLLTNDSKEQASNRNIKKANHTDRTIRYRNQAKRRHFKINSSTQKSKFSAKNNHNIR